MDYPGEAFHYFLNLNNVTVNIVDSVIYLAGTSLPVFI